MLKKIFVFGASKSNVQTLEEMSKYAHVFAFDKNPHVTESKTLAVIREDYSNTEIVKEYFRKINPDGIYPMSDHAIVPCATILENSKLFGYRVQTAQNFLFKHQMRKLWKDCNLPQPVFAFVNDIVECERTCENLGYPLIIKPSSSGGGGRGVYKIKNKNDLHKYFPKTKEHCRYSPIIVCEKFVNGTETSVEFVLLNGEGHLICYSEKIKMTDDSQVATEISYPGNFNEETIAKVKSICTEAMKALGVTSGIGHFELIIDDKNDPYLIEVGGRVGGGHTFHPIASHVSGVSYPEIIVNLYTNQLDKLKENLKKITGAGGAVYAFPITKLTGKIESIGFNKFLANERTLIEVWKSPGQNVNGLNDSMDRLGCVVALEKDRNSAIERARSIINSFQLEIGNSTNE